MGDVMAVRLTVNGQEVKADVPEDMSLMRFLREEMGLTGTKNGCASGHCGACTVILNGRAARSCLVKMGSPRLKDAQVETIEGLTKDGSLHPLQEAFIIHRAFQCGYCTPGMIVAAKALLDENPQPTAEEIKAALTRNRNTCRCTGYVNVVKAIQAAAEVIATGKKLPEAPQVEPGQSVGAFFIRQDAVEKVTGRTKYSGDFVLENTLYGKILWSAHPHAEILGLDPSAAEAMEGVALVLTAKDIPGKNQLGILKRDQPAIADEKVRYIGDPVAGVFAETEEIAQAALEKIVVDYRPLPGVFSPQEAAREDAPLVHEGGNLLHHALIERGDVEAAFEQCAVVFENSYHTPFIEHAFIEPEAGLGIPDEDGGVTIKIGTQCVFDDRTQLSEVLDMPEEKIRVVQLPIGGAFGAKEDILMHQFLALGALKTGRPVKIVFTRQESLRTHPKRHRTWLRFKTGADKDGHVLAVKADIVADTGAYASLGVDVLENMVVFACGPYYVPHVRLEGWAWYTNNVPAGAMRGFGANQVEFALETQMDMMARALKMDPFEFRHLNGLAAGLPTAADHVLEPGVAGIKETIAAAREALEKTHLPESKKKTGIGVACGVKNIGFGHGFPESAGAIVKLKADGSAQLLVTHHEYGQGALTAQAQLVAAELGVPFQRIEVQTPHTALTPPTGPTTASRQTFMTGNAVVMACRALKEELFSHAAEALEADPAQIALQGDQLIDRATGKQIPLSHLGAEFVAEKRYQAPSTAPLLEGEASHYGKPDFESRPTHWCYAYGTQVAIVEVDAESGQVKVLKVIAAHDVGRALNPPAIEGQIQGGVVMGMGYALSEEFVVEQGLNLTDSLHKCRLPTAAQTPEIVPVIVEVPHPQGPWGAKGLAEAPSLATAPAITNAIYDAVGVRVFSLPAAKEKIRQALEEGLTRI